ncbi:hypothetical protein B484DRAFT_450613 [Ochromonadaceae sp. CCMP2298]|nr:hypothetical protein B484DRAFT_450613 [Ochromonadaceae sp. CCMP2298]
MLLLASTLATLATLTLHCLAPRLLPLLAIRQGLLPRGGRLLLLLLLHPLPLRVRPRHSEHLSIALHGQRLLLGDGVLPARREGMPRHVLHVHLLGTPPGHSCGCFRHLHAR